MTKLFLKNSSGKIIKTSSGNCNYITVPQDYVEIEYIDNPDNRYLDTGVTAANKLFVMDIQFTNNINRQLMGISGSSFAYFGNNAGIWEKIGTTGTSYTTLDRVTLYYDVGNITANKTNCWLQGATNKFQGSDTNYATASANTLKLFGLAGNSYICKMKLYSLRVYDSNGTLLNYFVPVKYNNDVGIYDLITRVFKKAVSGTFAAGPRIPSEYQEVTYIESDGNAYINTEYLNTSTPYQVDCDMEITGSVSGNYWFGQQQGHGSMMYNGLYRNNSLEFNWLTVSRTANTRCTMTQRLLTDLATVEITMNGASVQKAAGTNDSTGKFLIFACNPNSSPVRVYGSSLRLYSFRIHEGSSTVRNFIPCYRKSDNVIGLYDTVDDIFYINSGSGSFTKGSNV